MNNTVEPTVHLRFESLESRYLLRSATTFDLNQETYGVGEFVALDDYVYFLSNDAQFGIEIWRTDGTEQAQLVKDIGPSNSNGVDTAVPVVNLNGRLFFVADDGVHGPELWTSDGSTEGTSIVKDIHSNRFDMPRNLIAIGDSVFFTANDGVHGVELWMTDGTDEGTRMVLDLRPGSASSFPSALIEFDGELAFTAYGPRPADDSSTIEPRIFFTNGEQTTALSTVGVTPNTGFLYSFERDLYFESLGDDGLWRYSELGGVIEQVVQQRVKNVKIHNDSLFFTTSTNQLWKRNDTETIEITPIGYGIAADLAIVGQHLLTANEDGIVWRVDAEHGTPQRTTWPSTIMTAVEFEDGFNYFVDCGNGCGLWKTDGSEVTLAVEIGDVVDLDVVGELIVFNRRMFFEANDGTGKELWSSNGTPDGCKTTQRER